MIQHRNYVLPAVVLLLLTVLITACAVSENNGSLGYTNITAEELKELLDNNADVLLIDVRRPKEYNSGHIPGSVLYPLSSIENWAHQLEQDQKLVLICRSGNRSAKAAAYLVEAGFTDVNNLVGGVKSWRYGLEKNHKS